MLGKLGTLLSSLPEIVCPQVIRQYSELQPSPGSQMKKCVTSLWTLNQLQTSIIRTNDMSYNVAPKTCADDVEVKMSPEGNSVEYL